MLCLRQLYVKSEMLSMLFLIFFKTQTLSLITGLLNILHSEKIMGNNGNSLRSFVRILRILKRTGMHSSREQ